MRHANNRNIWLNLRDRFPHPYLLDDARAWLAAASVVKPQTSFAIDVGGAAVGAVGLELEGDVFHRSAEIGYWLGEMFWGRGIASEAVRAFTDWGFEKFDLLRIYAGVFDWNPASGRVLEKAGYALEGRMRQNVVKDGRICDRLIYARIR